MGGRNEGRVFLGAIKPVLAQIENIEKRFKVVRAIACKYVLLSVESKKELAIEPRLVRWRAFADTKT